MASKQRARAPKKGRSPNQLADLGLFNIPDLDAMDNDIDSDVDENALESELEALLSGKAPSKPTRPKKKAPEPMDIEKMAAECMKDVDDEDDDDDDESVLMDPDLLKELKGLSCESPSEEDVLKSPSSPKSEDNHIEAPEEKVPAPSQKPSAGSIVTLLEDRLKLYNEAVAAAAKANDNSKARRYGRAVKTLEQLLKSAKAGRNVNEEDIPPVVNIPKAKSRPPPPPSEPVLPPEPVPEPSLPVTNNIPTEKLVDILSDDVTEPHALERGSPDVNELILRRDQYKVAAVQAKRAGDKTTALNYIKISKGFDAVIEAVKNGEPVDLSNIPPPPPSHQATIATLSDHPQKEHDETQTSSMEAAALSAASEPEDPALFAAPPAPSSILEALDQRLEKYISTKAAAEAEGNGGKVRRLQRIIKSYEKAIKDYKAGKEVNFEELPTPPGFAPIPSTISKDSQKPSDPPTGPSNKTENKAQTKEVPVAPPKRPAPEAPPRNTQTQKPKVQRTNTSTVEKQLEFLLERQKMFRQAALASKKNGDIEQAKNYLRLSKGFDSMIEATKCGLPIDASSIPTPPQLESDFVVVDVSDCVEDDGTAYELLETLENDLTKQIEVCTRNKEHFLKLGDVSSASKFEKLGLESRKDLSVIRHLKKTGQAPPKFHYETRLFSIVQCNTDLSDNDLVVTIERGINLPGKADDLDSFIRLEFPIPSDAPQKAKSNTVKDTNNPIFQEEFKFEINRKSRAQLRQFKRGALKLEVWSKGGFLRSDTLLGTVNVKLVDLESKCCIHDSFDLLDGRKACGGKLEVRVRIRHPLLVKQVEEVREKWLVIGS